MASRKFDSLLDSLGHFGIYQKRIYFLVCLPTITSAMHKLAWVFLGAKPAHRCQLEENDTYTAPSCLVNESIPWDEGSHKWSQCEMWNSNTAANNDSVQLVPCKDWVYDTSTYLSSAVIEWNLVCDDSWKQATAQAVFMVGVLFGSLIFGDFADRFGRKPVLFTALTMQVVFGIVAGLMPEYYSFIMARLLIGMSTSGVFLVGYVLGLELVGPSKRMVVGITVHYFYTLGYLVMALYAYFIPSWRWLEIAMGLTGLLFIPYWWLLPESSRWLVSQGKGAQAELILLKVAKTNKVDLDPDLLQSIIHQDSQQELPIKKHSIIDLMRFPQLRKKSINLFFCWFVNSGVYYGLSLNTSNLGGNDYFNFLISGAVEVPAYILVLLTLNRIGRRLPLCIAMLIAGIALVLTLAVPEDRTWLLITLAMLGKMAITASYGIIYIFSAELFPTVVRNIGMGVASTFARVGGICAPYINLLGETWKPFPLVIFGGLSFASGLLALLLPDTVGKVLPDSLEDAEAGGVEEKKAERNNVTSLVQNS